MNIIKLAKEAGLLTENVGTTNNKDIMWVDCALWGKRAEYGFTFAKPELLERFAALVAAHEREACAKVCDERHNLYPQPRIAAECAAAIRARDIK